MAAISEAQGCEWSSPASHMQALPAITGAESEGTSHVKQMECLKAMELEVSVPLDMPATLHTTLQEELVKQYCLMWGSSACIAVLIHSSNLEPAPKVEAFQGALVSYALDTSHI